MNDEANYIVRKAGINITSESGFMHKNSQITTDERYTYVLCHSCSILNFVLFRIPYDIMKSRLESMNTTDLARLRERYADDYDAFGYQIDENFDLSGW